MSQIRIWKRCCQHGGVEPATSWSPVGRASNWATEAGARTVERKRNNCICVWVPHVEFCTYINNTKSHLIKEKIKIDTVGFCRQDVASDREQHCMPITLSFMTLNSVNPGQMLWYSEPLIVTTTEFVPKDVAIIMICCCKESLTLSVPNFRRQMSFFFFFCFFFFF